MMREQVVGLVGPQEEGVQGVEGSPPTSQEPAGRVIGPQTGQQEYQQTEQAHGVSEKEKVDSKHNPEKVRSQPPSYEKRSSYPPHQNTNPEQIQPGTRN